MGGLTTCPDSESREHVAPEHHRGPDELADQPCRLSQAWISSGGPGRLTTASSTRRTQPEVRGGAFIREPVVVVVLRVLARSGRESPERRPSCAY